MPGAAGRWFEVRAKLRSGACDLYLAKVVFSPGLPGPAALWHPNTTERLREIFMFKKMAGAAVILAAGGAFWMAAALGPQSGSFSAGIRRNIYPAPAAAESDIRHAEAEAAKEHKNVLLEFGGDWCGDCLVLNYYMHRPPNEQLLENNYVVVDVNVGHLDENLDLAARYGVPIKKGVPLVAILDPHGRLLYSQRQGGFDIQLRSGPDVVTALLNQWKPSR